MNRLPASIENVVVGGGIIGLAVAHELARRGRPVALLERDRVGGGATAAAGGMLAPVSEAEIQPAELVTFGQDSLLRYPGFVRGVERASGVDCGYDASGTLWIALRQDDLAELDHVAATLAERGFDAVRLGGQRIRELEPHLAPRVVGGLRVAGDHQVDPRALVRALERAAVADGATVAEGCIVESIEAEAGRVRHVRGRGPAAEPFTIEAERVVLAAGAWSERGLRLPIPELGLRPVKGQLVRLHGARLLRHVVRAPGAYLVPRGDGELLVGATMEEMGFDDAPTAGAVMDLLWRAFEALPGAYELGLSEVSVGLRPAVADHLPVIGESELPGLFLALGHHRDGVLLAPATAHHLATWMLEGVPPEALAPFAARRLTGEGVR